MSLVTLLIIILLIAALGGLPQTGLHDWGYRLSGGIGVVLVILLVLLLIGRI